MERRKKPHYGYYSLYLFIAFSATIIIAGLAVKAYLWAIPGYILIGFGIYLIVSYFFSILTFNQSESYNPPEFLIIRGDEDVLDVGCGLGLIAVGIAKRLTSGKVVGIDVWSTVEIPGNSPERAYENAMLEGVADKVEFKSGNVLDIPFEDESFDLVTSGSVLNNLKGEEDKLKALSEIYRVLRPGGMFLLIEPLRDLWGLLTFTLIGVWMLLSKEEWTKILTKSLFQNLRYAYVNRVGVFLMEKPAD
jgi:ubiquinone/menaquinone biosynthesis C-methylase UbiE